MPSRRYRQADLAVLWARAGGKCSFPECRNDCVIDDSGEDPEITIGEVAHIVAHSDTGPRADIALSEEDRRRYPNLILLCPNCHTKVDKQPNSYRIADLRTWKQQHELWVKGALAAAMPEVGFAELKVVTHAILATGGVPSTDFRLTNPQAKLRKNQLSDRSLGLLRLGLVKAREVDAYVDGLAVLDPEFANRLVEGFRAKYRRLKENGALGDELFDSLAAFAAGNASGMREQAAGLAVLAYLFEKCEVFEK